MKKLNIILGIFGLAFTLLAPPKIHAEEIYRFDSNATGALNHLIERYIDGEKGFRESAEQLKDSGLKDEFLKKSDQRKRFREELQGQLAEYGEDFEKGGSVAGAAHRAWIDMKSAVAPNDDLAVLNAARTGEEEAVKSYKELIGSGLPEDLKDTVQGQYEEVIKSYTWVIGEIKARSKEEIKDRNDAINEAKDAARG